MEFMFERPDVRDRFLEIYQNRGGMTPVLKRVPLTVVKQQDLGTRGCINYAMIHKIFHF
jgi:hypothetical protein